MCVNKSKISRGLSQFSYVYRWGCGPKVSLPSEKGYLYWNAPSFIPSIYKAKALGNTKTPGTNILEKSTIEHCMKKYMYIWLNNGTEFWSVPIIVKDNYIHIWIWNKVKWTYYTMVLDNINSFMCYWHTTYLYVNGTRFCLRLFSHTLYKLAISHVIKYHFIWNTTIVYLWITTLQSCLNTVIKRRVL